MPTFFNRNTSVVPCNLTRPSATCFQSTLQLVQAGCFQCKADENLKTVGNCQCGAEAGAGLKGGPKLGASPHGTWAVFFAAGKINQAAHFRSANLDSWDLSQIQSQHCHRHRFPTPPQVPELSTQDQTFQTKTLISFPLVKRRRAVNRSRFGRGEVFDKIVTSCLVKIGARGGFVPEIGTDDNDILAYMCIPGYAYTCIPTGYLGISGQNGVRTLLC